MANDSRHVGEQPNEEARQRRHESHASATYKAFLGELCVIGGFDPPFAEKAAVSVLGMLEQRIYGEEVKDLEAQLPSKLRELLQGTARHEGKPERKFGKEELFDSVSRDLGKNQDDVEPIVRAVFAAVRAQISEGEAEDVSAQLPPDLAALWRLPA